MTRGQQRLNCRTSAHESKRKLKLTASLGFEIEIRIIDPSAGSPTETLLRLLLPLSNKVYLTFQTAMGCPAAIRSEIFTGLLNR